jgi:hypothetical protein
MKIHHIKTMTALLTASTATWLAATPASAVQPYVEPIGSAYQIIPILSVADQVPETSDPSLQYQMIGIPDGLGAYDRHDGTIALLMNHELTKGTMSQPVVGGPMNRGAIISRFILSQDGTVLSGERAYDTVFDETAGTSFPAADDTNSSPDFTRFCSGNLAGPESGFDRPLYFAGEESGSPNTFDGRGGTLTVTFDNEIHTLSKFPRIPWENALPRPFNGNETVFMRLEDGPTTPDSQLYMYVGKKDRRHGSDVLSRNGLNNGRVYVFVSTTPGKSNEVTFQDGSISGRWQEIPNAGSMTDVELETASDAAGAFGFIRIEDGAWSKTSRKDFYFVTTGDGTGNLLGRLYHLELNPGNPLKPVTLSVVYNANQIIAAGGDVAISPDNIDTSEDYIVICEDGTGNSRPVMAQKGRDGSIWRFDLHNNFAWERVAELNPPGRDGIPVGPGIWETSGIIDTTSLFGNGSWLVDTQAHSPTTPPGPGTVEDGQLLIMVPAN